MKHLFLSFILTVATFQAFGQFESRQLENLFSSVYGESEPGAVVAIIKNGKVIFKQGYGLAEAGSERKIGPTTNFNIGSLTKQFTAFSVLKLADENKLSLDDNLGKFFPEFYKETASRVTVLNLLTHSSGIVDHYNYVNKSLFTEFGDKDVLNAVKSVDSVYFKAGSAYRYSNTAYCLLALIIGHVSGLSFPEYLRQNIFEPKSMHNSLVIQPGIRIKERALGYEYGNETHSLSDAGESMFFSTMGDGGIYTSADEYLKWMTMILNRKGPDHKLVDQVLMPQFVIDSTRQLSYGYGWFVAGSGRNRIAYHTGSNGGFRAIVFSKPSEKYGVIILSNRTGIDLEDLVHQINNILRVDDTAFVRLESLIN